MARTPDKPENDEPVYNGATFEAMSAGPTKIVLAGMFHQKPDLTATEMTVSKWEKAIAAFLAAPSA